jgi:hypothetical protein
LIRKIWDEKVNGFWVGVCQDVPFRTQASAKNPIDCRIYFADNARRKTESGVGGRNTWNTRKGQQPCSLRAIVGSTVTAASKWFETAP